MKSYLAPGAAITMLLLGILLTLFLLKPDNRVPASVKQQASFAILQPIKATQYQLDKDTVIWDNHNKFLTFSMINANTKVVVTQQPTPESFAESDKVFPALLNKMHQYASFDSTSGTVTLTKPKELNGGQAAVVNNRGTLLFARPDRNLNDAEWHEIFNHMEVAK